MRKKMLLLLMTGWTAAYGADYNIVDYGAKADTTILCTAALQQAIDDCSRAGGGRVVVPAGMYKTGSIRLKSHVCLYLEQGATLYGSTRLSDYMPMKSDYVSLRTNTETIQLIYADQVSHVTIDGDGTIDGQGRAFKKLSWNDEGITRPHLLRFIQSSDITVRGITLRNSGCWMQHYLACDRLHIDGIKVFNRNNYNNDALDLDGCHDVIVRGIGICQDGIFIESEGQRQIIQSGHYQRLWLRITNNSLENTHQFAYSTDGQRFVSAGSAFSMHSGYWKGIRVGLFCYGNDGKAQFDVFSQKVSH